MTTVQIEIPILWVWGTVAVIGAASAFLGILSFLWPRGSIGFYIWIMSRINWRISPIDEGREIRTTRRFGFFLLLLGGASLVLAYFFYFKGVYF